MATFGALLVPVKKLATYVEGAVGVRMELPVMPADLLKI
jgi:hypothetical protein